MLVKGASNRSEPEKNTITTCLLQQSSTMAQLSFFLPQTQNEQKCLHVNDLLCKSGNLIGSSCLIALVCPRVVTRSYIVKYLNIYVQEAAGCVSECFVKQQYNFNANGAEFWWKQVESGHPGVPLLQCCQARPGGVSKSDHIYLSICLNL